MSQKGELTEVPAIDLAPSFDPGEAGRDRVAAEIRRACEEIGFFSVIGHRVPDDVVAVLQREAKDYFALPLEEKLKTPQPPEKISRGYSHVGSRGLAFSMGKETPPDLQESFAMGPVKPAPSAIVGTPQEKLFFFPNSWPEQRPGFRAAFEAYYCEMDRLAVHILRLFARALKLDDGFFDEKVNQATSTMRAIYYPPQEQMPALGQLRAGEHTDYDTLTILKGDDVPGGLQVKLRHGGWVDVHPRSDAFVCNVGDLMMRWTNDEWVSNLHRVANPPPEAMKLGRLSVPFFHNPNVDAEIRCVTSFYGKGEKYPPVRFGDFYLSKHMKAQNMTKAPEASARSG
ncbi:isopenicillin N synthase family dioxygenase [Bradyrhizobium commune]|uniref:2-oxoglutarate-dependent ethylene/succinate-forming enzyme n=1 Tax=Bradyrhizobium commune TaxID=83627 RepID=A0A7S9GY79_9BRAD|nr:isopenicillin N synthase family oxygenase [Bradyrhizobium commune]QPF89290.1 isopenicillin N synthase family oxygenase [Bradyrhizobium commune]